MVKSVISAITTIGGAIAGSSANTGFGGIFRIASAIYTAIDSLTNKQNSAVNKAVSPTYTFGKLQTQVSNLIPRPIVYGKVKIAGNKIWQTGENTSTIRQIVCLCDGEINSISDVRLNDIPIAELPGCSYTAYNGNGTQGIDERVPGTTQSDKAARVGGLKYDAYLAITAQASKELNSSGFNVTCVIDGKNIRVYSNVNSYSVQYSNNPAWCILDFLTCYNGMGLSHDEIDIQSFIDAANYCDVIIDGQPRFTLNIALDVKQSRLDWLNAMLLVCRGYLLYQEGKIYLKIDDAGSSVQSFNSSNIIAGSERFWTTPRENKYDVVKVQFIDPENEYARVYAVAELPVYGNEQPLVKPVEAFGITNFKQASRLAWFYLNEASTVWKFMTFTTTKSGLDRTIGDIIDVTSEVMGYSGKLFRIISMNELQEGQIEINCKEYNGNLYTDTQGSVAPSIDVIAGTNSFSTGVTDITLHGNADKDQTRVLQQHVNNLSKGTGGILNVDSADAGVYINAALNVKSNVHVNFKCPVLLGKYGQLRIYGSFYETPAENLPQIRADLTAGTKVIYCGTNPESRALNYTVGDRIVIRGMSDGNGQAIERQETTVTGVDSVNNNIYVQDSLEYDFKSSYPAGDYEESFGVVDRTYITFMTYSTLTASVNRGATEINVLSTGRFSAGDYIFIGDNKTPSDIAGSSTNTYRHEVNKILSIEGNIISLENALSHNYETAYNACITKMDMVENASIQNAKVSYVDEPASFTVNAFTIAYSNNCYIRDCIILNDGSHTSKGHGFRIDRSINCTIDNCTVNAPKHVAAAEGYGFTIYRANHNFITNCKAYGCRHSFLLFRGACNNRINNVLSVNARVSDFDFHGGEESFNTIDGFTIVGGNQKFGNNLSAIKFGNEYHVAGCFGNIVRNGSVINYKGYGIDIVPASENNLVENVSFKNIERFVRSVDLSIDESLKTINNTIRNCFIDTVSDDLGNINGTLNGGTSHVIDGLTIDNNVFRNINTYFTTLINTANCRIVNNTFLNGVENRAAPWFLNARNCASLHILGNYIENGNNFVSIKDCYRFICTDNRLKNFYSNVILDDINGNNGYLFRNNYCEGFEGVCETSEGGSDNGINIKNSHISTELVVSDILPASGLNITGIIPFDNSLPLINEGCEILNCVYQPRNNLSRLKIECFVPAVYTDTATNVVLALFKGNTCIGASGIRLPNTGASSGHFIQLTAVTDITSLNPFCLSLRIGPKTNGPIITVGDRFNKLGVPYIIITETGITPSENCLYTEDLSSLILTEDYKHIIKE